MSARRSPRVGCRGGITGVFGAELVNWPGMVTKSGRQVIGTARTIQPDVGHHLRDHLPVGVAGRTDQQTADRIGI